MSGQRVYRADDKCCCAEFSALARLRVPLISSGDVALAIEAEPNLSPLNDTAVEFNDTP